MPSTLVEIKRLGVRFPSGLRAVRSANLRLSEGEIVALVGASGSGKSAFARAIMGLHRTATVEGEIVFATGCRPAMIFQDPQTALDPLMRVGRQIVEAVRAGRKMKRAAAKAKAIDLLTGVGINDPAGCYRLYPHQLSGGMGQRVLCAIALAAEPKLLIADEPTTALDVGLQKQILELLCTLCKQRGMALLLITHDETLVENYAERVVEMRGGVIQSRRERVVAPTPAPLPERAHAPAILELDGLSKTGRLRPLSLSVERGEIVGIVGESGSGKTTLARLIAGLERPTGGSIKRYSSNLQMVFQNPHTSFNPRMRLIDSVTEGAGVRREDAIALTHRVGLPTRLLERYPHQCSGGQLQRLAIARALAARSDLLILDEALSSLDNETRDQVSELLQCLHKELGISYLFIAHDLPLVRRFCHRVAVLYRGDLVEVAQSDQLFERPEHPYTQQLVGAMTHLKPARRAP